MFDRRLFLHIDWTLIFIVVIISILGILSIYSATYPHQGNTKYLYLRQIYWVILGLALLFLVISFDYHLFIRLAYPFFTICLLLLLLVILWGKLSSGSQRWLHLGFFSFQPSELTKLALILALTRFFTREGEEAEFTLRDLFMALLFLGLPALLVFKQPDLGTAVLMVIISISLFGFIGFPLKAWLLLGGGAAVLTPFLWQFLKEYQKKRLLTFINPDLDPLKTGYHIIQSKIAVGSGSFWGKGFLKGTQSQLHFIPEQHTDFIFSVFAEEWGFVGCLFLLFLMLLLISKGLKIALASRDRAGTLLAVGITAMIFWQVFINIGMVLGIVPVVGIPLPLFSYGGTSVITTMVGVGLLINIEMRRFLLSR
jgi:rod shape determining protein RodA